MVLTHRSTFVTADTKTRVNQGHPKKIAMFAYAVKTSRPLLLLLLSCVPPIQTERIVAKGAIGSL